MDRTNLPTALVFLLFLATALFAVWVPVGDANGNAESLFWAAFIAPINLGINWFIPLTFVCLLLIINLKLDLHRIALAAIAIASIIYRYASAKAGECIFRFECSQGTWLAGALFWFSCAATTALVMAWKMDDRQLDKANWSDEEWG